MRSTEARRKKLTEGSRRVGISAVVTTIVVIVAAILGAVPAVLVVVSAGLVIVSTILTVIASVAARLIVLSEQVEISKGRQDKAFRQTYLTGHKIIRLRDEEGNGELGDEEENKRDLEALHDSLHRRMGGKVRGIWVGEK